MSLGIVFKGPEGIVLADSRVTLTAQVPQPNGSFLLLPATFDNATKLLRVKGQDFAGAVTYGAGAIGQKEPRTAHSFLPELESALAKEGVGRLSIADFSQRLADFFMQRWTDAKMPNPVNAGEDMVFLVGGYDEGQAYGRIFEISIPTRPKPGELNPGDFGVAWGGQRQITDRLVQGA